MATQGRQVGEGRVERQGPRLLQQSKPRQAGSESPSTRGRPTPRLFLRSYGRHEEEADQCQDSQRPRQPDQQKFKGVEVLTWDRHQGRQTFPTRTGITNVRCAISGSLSGAITKIKLEVMAVKAFVKNVIRSWINSESASGGTVLRPKILKLKWNLRTDAVLVAAWSLS